MGEDVFDLGAYLKKLEDDYKIPLLVSDVIAGMVDAGYTEKFIQYVVNKLLESWQIQKFETVEEGLRYLNAECYGVLVSLQLLGEKFDETKK